MGSRLGRRVVSFANLPIKLLMPTSYTNITEISLKTIPSASKVEIKRVLESLYGFEVEKVDTLNRDGKMKKRGGILFKKPDYKKAYVTLRQPLSISPDLFPLREIEDDRQQIRKQAESKSSSKSSIVDETPAKKHWLHEKLSQRQQQDRHKGYHGRRSGGDRRERAVSPAPARERDQVKFPWSSMRSVSLLYTPASFSRISSSAPEAL